MKKKIVKRQRKYFKETLFTISLRNLVMGSLLFIGFINANAQCTARPIPCSEGFSTTSLNPCTPTAGGWDTIGAPSTGSGWYIANSNNAGGSPPEIEAYGNQANGGVSQTMRLISPPVKTLGISTATLSFKHTLGLTNSGASGSGVITIKVESSPDKSAWTSLYSTTYNATSSLTYVVTETRTLTLSGLSSDSTFVRFSISGVLFKVNNWDIDNVSFSSPTTSVSLFNPSQELSVYPNPVSGVLTVNNTNRNSVSLIDVIGKTIYENNAREEKVKIDVSTFPKGIYFLQTHGEEGTTTRKIIVE
ncbi:MAG: T9SS type A sorting domain-containing protein [Bacteroidia bacterium]